MCSNSLINDGTCEKEGEIIINKKELKNKVLSKLFTITDKTNYPYSTDLKYEIEETGIIKLTSFFNITILILLYYVIKINIQIY